MASKDVKVRRAYRQGELLFVPLNAEEMANIGPRPSGTLYPRWKKLATNILREGEATGHKHEVVTETPSSVAILAPQRQFLTGLPDMDSIGSEDRLLIAEEPVEIIHPEHRTLRIPKGNFLVIVQREYDEVKAPTYQGLRKGGESYVFTIKICWLGQKLLDEDR